MVKKISQKCGTALTMLNSLSSLFEFLSFCLFGIRVSSSSSQHDCNHHAHPLIGYDDEEGGGVHPLVSYDVLSNKKVMRRREVVL